MLRRTLVCPSLLLTLSLGCADDGGAGGNSGTDEIETGGMTGATEDEVGESASTTGEATTTSSSDDASVTTDDPTGETSSDTSTDTNGDTTETTGEAEVVDLTFVVMGDAGEGNEGQYAVADAIEMVCADKGDCAFVLYLGDNFYDDGVGSAMDDQFQTKFELPYANLDLPFKIVLGNHDYGLLSFAWEKADYEIEYTNYSDKWELPSQWYSFSYPGVDFFVLDTTRFMWDHDTNEQQAWIDQTIGASEATWKFAAAHHPYLSNGDHGNAGHYENFPFPPQLAGTVVKEVLDESVCGKVDAFFSGHDHNRQWLVPTCQGTNLIVSGAGCKTTEFKYFDGGNDVYWEDDTEPGFMVVELTNDTMHTEFYDQDGVLDFARDVVK